MIEERKKQLAAKSEEKKKRSGAAAEQFGYSVRGMLCGLAGSLKESELLRLELAVGLTCGKALLMACVAWITDARAQCGGGS
ncbi:hypothetical protein F0562_003316 [Nyssa sinensis]|uniref:Uncharacterized protein n=1 Tax=Nyssa sinensis TaxID=561372 RepID=A0A5J5BZ07_9ASTE|nr:hypothetical protein F0562_003316 [Nyssa sinensis]